MIALSSIFTFNTIALSLISAYNTGKPRLYHTFVIKL